MPRPRRQHGGGRPGGLFGPAELAGISGACFEALAASSPGSRRPALAARAERHIGDALALREPFYVRSRVLDLAGLAKVRLCQDEPGEAVRVAAGAPETAVSLRSGSASRRLHALAIRALEVPPVTRNTLPSTLRSISVSFLSGERRPFNAESPATP